jgi:hypothetical protein
MWWNHASQFPRNRVIVAKRYWGDFPNQSVGIFLVYYSHNGTVASSRKNGSDAIQSIFASLLPLYILSSAQATIGSLRIIQIQAGVNPVTYKIYRAAAPQPPVAAASTGRRVCPRHTLNRNAQEGRRGMCNGRASEGRGCGPHYDCVASSLFNRGPSLSLGISLVCLPESKEKVIMNDQAIAVVSMALATRMVC